MRDAYLLLFLSPGDGDRWTCPCCAHGPKIHNRRAFGNANRTSALRGYDLLLGCEGGLCLWSAQSMAGILFSPAGGLVGWGEADKILEEGGVGVDKKGG